MNFFSEGKTNWCYLLIIPSLTILLGGGILAWQYLRVSKEEIKTPKEEVKVEEEVAKSETVNWKTYRNEEYGFEFKYPEDWRKIDLEEVSIEDTTEYLDKDYRRVIFKAQMKSGIYTFFSENKKIKKIWYQPSSKSLAFVEYGEEEYKSVDEREMRKQETLKIIGLKGKISPIYSVPENLVAWYGKLGAIRFSPDGNYICFIEDGWEYAKPMIFNVQTKKNILEDIDIWFGRLGIYQNIFWSPNNKVLVIKSEASAMGGEGTSGLFVSDYERPEKLNQVFAFYEQPGVAGRGSKINFFECFVFDIRFMGDEKLFFSAKFIYWDVNLKPYEKRYEYIIKTKELNEIK